VNLSCMSAYLPFENGRAAAEPIAGIRSDASQMLGSGYFDLKRQTMDLRGRVRARSGVNLGVANIAGGDLKIAGRIAAPAIGLDPESTPAALARIGAAIMTSGVSILATALWDAANPASDPCQITFSAHEKRPPSKPRIAETSEASDYAN
jgi:AsmA family protein